MKKTTAQTLTFQYFIDIGQIADKVGVVKDTASRVLDPERFLTARYQNLVRVRREVEAELRRSGYSPPAGRTLSEHLWSEYDQVFDKQRAA